MENSDWTNRVYSSTSNLSSTSSNSSLPGISSVARRRLYLSLPSGIELGASVTIDGRVLELSSDGTAHGTGVIQVGDQIRLLNDGNEDELVRIQVTYTVLVVEGRPQCPFLIQIGNPNLTPLGIAFSTEDKNEDGIRVVSIQQGSLAERCGYLEVGDRIQYLHLKKEGKVIACANYSSLEIAQMLRKITLSERMVTLTVLPGNLHKEYLKEQFSFSLWKDSSFDDWGFSIADNEVGNVTIHETRTGGPAFQVGLLPGDEILQINNRDVQGWESTILVPFLASLDDVLNIIVRRNLS